MICKWCGESIKAGTRTCRRCKRELPALSDCGGFYDLVPRGTPVPPVAPEPQSAVQPLVRPVIPQARQNNLLIQIAFGVSAILALILLVVTISLSNKLADAREEAEYLRDQNKSREESTETQPSTSHINGLEGKDPEPTEDTAEVQIIVEDCVGEIDLNEAQNAQLNTGILQVSVFRHGEEERMLAFTIQRQPTAEDAEELFLQITDAGSWTIRSIEWRSSSLIELPIDGIDGLLPTPPEDPAAGITEFSQPISELGEGSVICTLTGVDENGEELTITILNIVID